MANVLTGGCPDAPRASVGNRFVSSPLGRLLGDLEMERHRKLVLP